jgi:hypothetical protein
VSIVPVNNLRYSVEGYVERRHPEFAYDTGLNRFFADFIDCALANDFGAEYAAMEKWTRTMSGYDDTTYVQIAETLTEVIRRVAAHLGPQTYRFNTKPSWDWLNSRQTDVVIYGRPRWT